MVDYRIEHRNDAGAVERILRSLPAWFGIEESLLEYVESARTQESYLVLAGDVVVGVGLVVRRFPESAEIELLAVHADHRGRGAGRVLIEAIVEAVTRDGIQLLSVHTVGPSYRTRPTRRPEPSTAGSGSCPCRSSRASTGRDPRS
ncbi:GNAT family N-acetyltransferase [Plantibacter sp. YIM 135249]|uniref:GNAT family N-acetyltransferase n=1 Tax=Plantibacter sp. YIM 135249 TaxID=3423918 RepID=UPI003D333B36